MLLEKLLISKANFVFASKILPISSRIFCQDLSLTAPTTCRRYSQYTPDYQKPITRKEELAEPLADDDPRLFMPIRAATDDSCPHVFSDPLVNKLVNMLMTTSRKALARQIVSDAFERIKRIQVRKYWTAKTDEERATIECDPLVIFHTALKNVSPILWLVPVARGGIIYQVPMPINETKSRFRGFQFIRDAARDRERHRERRMMAVEKLSTDLLDAYHNTGVLMKKKQDLYRVCEANKSYASYRWQK